MAEPSAVLDDIVSSLQSLLGANVSVKAHRGNFEGKDIVTTRHAAVLVACTSLDIDPECDWEPPVANGQFVAFVFAKVDAHPKSKYDIAMDLAALIASHVKRSPWLDDDGIVRRAERIRVLNLHSREHLQDGLSIWSVTWTQQVELTPVDNDGVLNLLGEIRTTFVISDDEAVPTISHEADFISPDDETPPEEP
jgi:hypothetical protein